MESSTGWFWFCLFFISFGSLIVVAITLGDNVYVDIRGLGREMCQQHNLEYKSYEMQEGTYIPTIICQNKTKQIEDGYLKLE